MGALNNVYDVYNDMLDKGMFASNATIVTISSDTTTVGAVIDTQGYAKLAIVFSVGVMTDGDFEFKIYHDTAVGMGTEAELASTDYTGTIPDWDDHATEDDSIELVDITLRKRYVRIKCVSTSTSTGAIVVCIGLLHGARHLPVNSTQTP